MSVIKVIQNIYLVIIVSVIFIAIALLILAIRKNKIYVKDYYRVVNSEDMELHNAIILSNGEIKKMREIIELEEIIEVKEIVEHESDKYNYGDIEIYTKDGRIFVFQTLKGRVTHLCRVEVEGDTYRFGKYNIGIGTAKQTIEKIYKYARYCQYDSESELTVVDGEFEIEYYFDDSGKVLKMVIGKQGIFTY